jgi:protein-S-isoprenylcysteine O-methyltransferase Ste14
MLLVRFGLMAALGPLLLFLAAGDLGWTRGWIFAVFTFAYTLISRWAVFSRNPDLIAERAQSLRKTNVEPWDRVLVPVLGVLLPAAVVIVAGLDRRFRWSPEIREWIPLAALAAMFLGGSIAQWAASANRFFSSAVRIQDDRGHYVVTAGPYRVVRHPGYLGGLIFTLAIPPALGSLWALVPAAAAAALTVLRTSLEDRTLVRKLPGYAEYAAKTRRRLLPGVW